MIDDFLDKDKRKNNLVVHNLPEPDAGPIEDRSKQDVEQFQRVVKDTFKLQVKITKTFRVGKVTPGKPRLLIVTLDQTEAK